MIFLKDEDGLFTDDPKKNPDAKIIKKITVAELKALNLKDMIIERKVLELMENANFIKRVQIINGLKPGNLTKALEGKEVGTIIYT